MQLPTPLLRRKSNVHKNQFGHVLILAGCGKMLGAGALTSLAAIRSGAGLVTLGVPQSLNSTVQKKIANVIMTLPLKETREQTLAFSAFMQIKNSFTKYNAIAIGPGLSQNSSTRRLILRIIETSPIPLIIDADALNALCQNLNILKKTKIVKILTPHLGEMSRLTGKKKALIEIDKKNTTRAFVEKYQCTVLLKGAKTIVISPGKRTYANITGNSGMATAGSGDVLTGMITAFIAQGLSAFDAAKYGAYLHGKAGNLAAKNKTRLSMIASDIIEYIPKAVRSS